MHRLLILAFLIPGVAYASCPADLTDCPTVNANTVNIGTNLHLPVWTTASRPASPQVGQAGFNTDIGLPEFWDGSNWVLAGSGGVTPSEGACNQLDLSAACNSQYIGALR